MKKSGIGFNHLPAVAAALPKAGHLVVEKTCQDIAAGAGATAPIDTGALANSYFADTDGLHGIAGSNIEYAPFVEYGTRYNRAQPHLVPSADRVASRMGVASIKDVQRIVEGAARNGRT